MRRVQKPGDFLDCTHVLTPALVSGPLAQKKYQDMLCFLAAVLKTENSLQHLPTFYTVRIKDMDKDLASPRIFLPPNNKSLIKFNLKLCCFQV